jgi:hypothetical protein
MEEIRRNKGEEYEEKKSLQVFNLIWGSNHPLIILLSRPK